MHNFFVEDCGFPEKKCILLWNNGDKRKPEECPLEGMQQTVVDLADNDHELKKTFNTFLKTIQSDRLSKNKNEKWIFQYKQHLRNLKIDFIFLIFLQQQKPSPILPSANLL